MPVQHSRSSVWPLTWIGPLTCCVMLKQPRSDRNSEAKGHLVESTWILKPPSRSVDENMEQMEVSISDRKVEEAFGGW